MRSEDYAFPTAMVNLQRGMSMRDYFASLVLPALARGGYNPSLAALEAYKYADEMMKKREAK